MRLLSTCVRLVRAEAAGAAPLEPPAVKADGSPPPPPRPELTTVNQFQLVEEHGQLSDRQRLLGYLRGVASTAGESGERGQGGPTRWRRELIAAKIGTALLQQALAAYPTTLEQDNMILATSSHTSSGVDAAVIEEMAAAAEDPRVVRTAPLSIPHLLPEFVSAGCCFSQRQIDFILFAMMFADEMHRTTRTQEFMVQNMPFASI